MSIALDGSAGFFNGFSGTYFYLLEVVWVMVVVEETESFVEG